MTDWRGLCAELLAEWDSYSSGGDAWDRARAALALPVPEGPSDDELDYWWAEIDGGPDCCAWRPYARAVLDRWGRPAIEPVPVAERLPGEGDCNAERECFWFDGCDWKLDTFEKWYTHWLPHWALPAPASQQGP